MSDQHTDDIRAGESAIERARREGRHEALLKQLVATVDELKGSMSVVSCDVTDIKLCLRDGNAKMRSMDKELSDHLDEAINNRRGWKAVLPTVLASVLSGGCVAILTFWIMKGS